MKLKMPLRRVWMTLRSRASPKAWLPMKVIPETPVFGPSVDDEDKVHAVVRQLDHLRRDGRLEAAEWR